MLTKRQLEKLNQQSLAESEQSDGGRVSGGAGGAKSDSEAKRDKKAQEVLKKIVRDYVAKDELIKNAEAQLKQLKKNRDELREGIIAALQSAGVGACKLEAAPERAQPEVSLQLRARKLKVRPKKEEVVERIKRWMVDHGLDAAQGEECYETCIKAPVGEKEKVSLQRLKKGERKKKAAASKPGSKKKKSPPTVLLLSEQAPTRPKQRRPAERDSEQNSSQSEPEETSGRDERGHGESEQEE